MDGETYLRGILVRNSNTANLAQTSKIIDANKALGHLVRDWAGNQLHSIKLSGSNAKGTAISKSADLDLFISLKSDTSETLEELHDMLNRHLISLGYKPRLQNVSICIEHKGISVDLVPGKIYPSQGFLVSADHSIFVRKQKTRVKTNIDKQIKFVRDSHRADEIKLTKIWRNLHNIEFPSFYLELSVIKALGSNMGLLLPQTLSKKFEKILRYLSTDFEATTIEDPGNPSNKVSEELTVNEKKVIASAASNALKSNLDQVLW